MASIIEKVTLFLKSNVHDLLDKAIDWNSMGAVRQHVRDLQEAKDKVRNEAAVAKSRLAGEEKQVEHFATCISKCQKEIDLVLTDGDDSNDDLAVDIQKKLGKFTEQLEAKKTDALLAKQTADALGKASNALNSRFEEAVGNLRKLENLERTSKAKSDAAKAIKSANDIAAAASGGAAGFDSAESRLRDKAAVADAEFDDAMSQNASSSNDDIATIRAKQAVAARRAKLAGGAASGS
jgi:hypothetical protein